MSCGSSRPGAALAPPLVIGQLTGDAVQVLVLPAIVAGHALRVSAVDLVG